jgi:predicted membrane channel-forming protein YqfA (hemolysin III family)
MNPYIIVLIIASVCILPLAYFMRQGFLILLFWIILLALFALFMWLSYKKVFPPDWESRYR